ncbi:MAG TPA: hypothetical protein VI112_01525 [Bacteroidia bacterium]|jgi:hypothetical protein
MKYLQGVFFLSVLLEFFISCSGEKVKNPSGKVFYIELRQSRRKSLNSTDTFYCERSVNGNKYLDKWTTINGKSEIVYSFDLDQPSSGKRGNVGFHLRSSKEYTILKRDIRVYRFDRTMPPADGDLSLFWTSEYGLIAVQNYTWNSGSTFICTDDSINERLNILSRFILQDFDFYWEEPEYPKGEK